MSANADLSNNTPAKPTSFTDTDARALLDDPQFARPEAKIGPAEWAEGVSAMREVLSRFVFNIAITPGERTLTKPSCERLDREYEADHEEHGKKRDPGFIAVREQLRRYFNLKASLISSTFFPALIDLTRSKNGRLNLPEIKMKLGAAGNSGLRGMIWDFMLNRGVQYNDEALALAWISAILKEITGLPEVIIEKTASIPQPTSGPLKPPEAPATTVPSPPVLEIIPGKPIETVAQMRSLIGQTADLMVNIGNQYFLNHNGVKANPDTIRLRRGEVIQVRVEEGDGFLVLVPLLNPERRFSLTDDSRVVFFNLYLPGTAPAGTTTSPPRRATPAASKPPDMKGPENIRTIGELKTTIGKPVFLKITAANMQLLKNRGFIPADGAVKPGALIPCCVSEQGLKLSLMPQDNRAARALIIKSDDDLMTLTLQKNVPSAA